MRRILVATFPIFIAVFIVNGIAEETNEASGITETPVVQPTSSLKQQAPAVVCSQIQNGVPETPQNGQLTITLTEKDATEPTLEKGGKVTESTTTPKPKNNATPPSTKNPKNPQNAEESKSKTKEKTKIVTISIPQKTKKPKTETCDCSAYVRNVSKCQKKLKTKKLKISQSSKAKTKISTKIHLPYQSSYKELYGGRRMGANTGSDWFKEQMRRASEEAGKIQPTKIPADEQDEEIELNLEPGNQTVSKTFKQSLRVLKHSQLLKKISKLLKKYTSKTRRGDDTETFKIQAEKFAEAAKRKRNTAIALFKTDLSQNLQALKSAETEITNKLKLLHTLSKNKEKEAPVVPQNLIKTDVSQTQANALAITERLAMFLAKSLSKSATLNVSDIVQSALSVV